MKIVITGALGHIGSRLLRDLDREVRDCELVLIDNLATQRFNALFELPERARLRFVEGDVTELALEPLIAGAGLVVHLAAITDAPATLDKAELVECNNLGGTRRVAAACAGLGVPMVLPSSTSVYGTQQSLVDEDCRAECLNPQTPYALVKLKEEALLAELGAKEGLRFVVFRFGTIFGVSPGMRFHTAVNRFCWQAAWGQPLTIWRSAHDQKRAYLALEDATRAIAFALKQNLFDGRVYNVATLNATPREIVAAIREFVPDLDVAMVDAPILNQFSYEVSTRRIRARGFHFGGDLRRGILETLRLLGAVPLDAEQEDAIRSRPREVMRRR